jgi:putative tricarboxylic transport membrane protein
MTQTHPATNPATWRPQREVAIIAGTPPGGGLDRAARALARAIAARQLLDVAVRVVNVPGDGARRAWAEVDRHAGDAHVLSISSPNLTTDRLVGLAAFDHADYTPLAILLNEYIAFVARPDGRIASGDDLVQLLASNAGGVTVALSTALGNPNHIAFAIVTRHAGGDIRAPHIRVFDTALHAVADVVAGHADIGAVTAASATAEIAAGRLRAIAVSAPRRLAGPFATTPTWTEQGVDCVVGAWRGVTAPKRIGADAVAFWEGVLAKAVQAPTWQDDLASHCWTEFHLDGAPLHAYLAHERAEMSELLGALGLRKA